MLTHTAFAFPEGFKARYIELDVGAAVKVIAIKVTTITVILIILRGADAVSRARTGTQAGADRTGFAPDFLNQTADRQISVS